ncbi:MAG: SoxR reducing system RseC family protein [Paludibacteraceae bacterium]|nr:SoxR reducing system RseC family protein [Paludibacteraceae bacterium]
MSDNSFNKAEGCMSCSLKNQCRQTEESCYTQKQQWKALTLGYILPFVVLAGSVIGLSAVHINEWIICGVALGLVALYYLVLWACKPKI